jgi:hypothetical protein
MCSFPDPGVQFELISDVSTNGGWVLGGHEGPDTEYPPGPSFIGRVAGVSEGASDYWTTAWTAEPWKDGGVMIQHVASGGWLGTDWKEWVPNNHCVLLSEAGYANQWQADSSTGTGIYHQWYEEGGQMGSAFLELVGDVNPAGEDPIDPANPDAWYSCDFTESSGNPNQIWTIAIILS